MIVNPASFAIATGANSRLEQISKDYFIPKDTRREVSTEDESDGLDRIPVGPSQQLLTLGRARYEHVAGAMPNFL